MRVKDFARDAGITPAAIYKRVKALGMSLTDLQDPHTGELTADGIDTLEGLFRVEDPRKITELTTKITELKTEVTELTTKITKLTTEITELKTKLTSVETENAALKGKMDVITGERDYLRDALDRSQQLEGLALSKIPLLPPPAPAREKWYKRLFQKGEKV